MKNSLVIGLFAFLCLHETRAQDSIPLLTGKVNLSITKGTIECDFTLSHVPRIADYYIRINSGMNILFFKNLDANTLINYDKSFHDTLSYGESSAYYFAANGGTGKFLPRAIQFKYVGMYPVVKDTLKDYSVDDWKGNIAFNGYSVRTDGTQSAWYPILYDIQKDLKYDKVKYDIEVTCSDCNMQYINGSLPTAGTTVNFKSDVPQQLTMFSGKYKIAKVDDTYILNPDISEEQIKTFCGFTNLYKKFYEDNLHIPYKQSITYVQTTPTSKYNAWLFVSYPTIVNIGYGQWGMKSFFDKKKGDWFKPYIAHELGHYYFGTCKTFNTELGDMMSEGFSEYLSLTLTRALISDSVYKTKLDDKIKALKDFTAVPFAKVKSEADYSNRELYVYNYAPLIFTAIEKEIGQKNMWAWLKAILETKTDFTNYGFMLQTLKETLHDDNKFVLIQSRYFDTDKSFENAKQRIKQP